MKQKIYLFIGRVMERGRDWKKERKRKREKSSLFQLVHFPNCWSLIGHLVFRLAGRKAGFQELGPPPLAFSGVSAGSCFGSGASWNPNYAHKGFQPHRWQLNPLCHNANSWLQISMLVLKVVSSIHFINIAD